MEWQRLLECLDDGETKREDAMTQLLWEMTQAVQDETAPSRAWFTPRTNSRRRSVPLVTGSGMSRLIGKTTVRATAGLGLDTGLLARYDHAALSSSSACPSGGHGDGRVSDHRREQGQPVRRTKNIFAR